MASINHFLGLVLLLASTIQIFATTLYNSQTQLCCNGTVHDVNDATDMSCCGSLAYNYQESLCCYGDQPQVLTRPAEGTNSYGCCQDPATHANGIYDYQTQVCCDGTAINKPDATKYYSCCNGQLYDYTVQQCCGGQQLYDSATETCCATYGITDGGSYGTTAYKVTDILGNNTYCCGLQSYDSNEEVCCSDVIVPLPEGSKGSTCCGDEIYDYSKQICCTTWNHDESGNYALTGVAIHDYLDQAHSSQTCCGLEVYNYTESVCCDNKEVVAKPEGSDKTSWMTCCGGKVITNYTTQICHNDEIYEREGYNYYICGEALYNINTQFCCSETVYDNDAGLQCCYGAEIAYDPKTETCCDTTIEPLTSEDIDAGNDACCAVQQQYTKIMPAG